jgi:ABC-type branched-subunit amino acid transport system ATPase component
VAAVLQVEQIRKDFGGLRAVADVSFAVAQGEIVGLIGPNGSGKSTLFNVISGFYKPTAGTVRFRGQAIQGLAPEAIAARGLVRTFQLARPLASLSVLDNVLLGAKDQPGEHPLKALFTRRERWVRPDDIERAERLLALVNLWDHRDHPAGALSYGQSKLLALACAVMVQPAMLLLDEPMAGVNPTLGRILRSAIKTLSDEGMTFLIVEHDMGFVMEMCQRLVVLDHGEKIAEGTPAEIQNHPRVVAAYLGVAE